MTHVKMGQLLFFILHSEFVVKILNAVQKKLAAGPQNALKINQVNKLTLYLSSVTLKVTLVN